MCSCGRQPELFATMVIERIIPQVPHSTTFACRHQQPFADKHHSGSTVRGFIYFEDYTASFWGSSPFHRGLYLPWRGPVVVIASPKPSVYFLPLRSYVNRRGFSITTPRAQPLSQCCGGLLRVCDRDLLGGQPSCRFATSVRITMYTDKPAIVCPTASS